MKTLRIYKIIAEEIPVNEKSKLNTKKIRKIALSNNDYELVSIDSALLIDNKTGKYEEFIL